MTIFYDTDFENGTLQADGWSASNTPSIQFITTEAALSGTHCLKGIWLTQDGSGAHALTERVHTNTTNGWYRIGVRRDPNFLVGTGNLTKLFFLASTMGAPSTWLVMVGNPPSFRFDIQWPYDFNDTIVVNTGTLVPSDRFAEVEVNWVLNTPGVANGVFRVWVDGTLRAEITGRQFIGPTPTSTNNFNTGGTLTPSTLQLNYSQLFIQSGLGYVYLDRVGVGNTQLGLVGSPPDTMPPAAPTGVTVS